MLTTSYGLETKKKCYDDDKLWIRVGSVNTQIILSKAHKVQVHRNIEV